MRTVFHIVFILYIPLRRLFFLHLCVCNIFPSIHRCPRTRVTDISDPCMSVRNLTPQVLWRRRVSLLPLLFWDSLTMYPAYPELGSIGIACLYFPKLGLRFILLRPQNNFTRFSFSIIVLSMPSGGEHP